MSFFGNNSQAAQNNKLLGYPTQQSLFGTAIPILYGMQRIAGNVITVMNYTAIPISNGGKGSKGKGGGSNQQYNYSCAIAIGLCAGVVTGIKDAWLDRSHLIAATSSESYTIPGGGGSYTPVNGASAFMDMGAAATRTYSVTHNDYGSPGPVTLSGTQQVAMTRVTGTPASGQYSLAVVGGSYVYTFSAGDAGTTVTITYNWTFPTADAPTLEPLTSLSLTLFTGVQGQTPWSYTTSKYPSQAIGYSELAYVANSDLMLGQSGLVSNLSLEVISSFSVGGGIPDSHPAQVIPDFLSNPLYGVGFPSGSIGDLTELTNYCLANSLFISPLIDSQQDANTWIKEWILVANSEGFWSEGLLKFRTYGDTTAVGNGYTFTPNTTPIYDLDDDDYLTEDGNSAKSAGKDPITFTRPSVKDAYNDIFVEWTNRANSYNTETLDESDDLHIALYGHRPNSPITIHSVCLHNAAQMVANTQLKRTVYVRNVYSFKIGWWGILLEPMDMLTITDPNLGLVKQPVRILTIDEDDKLILTITAEEFPWGTARPTLYPKQVTGSFGPGYFADPGVVNTPVFLEPPLGIFPVQGGYVLLIGLSGGPNWGGADIYVSFDNMTYANVGKQQGPATVGKLTALLAGHTDPDDTNTLSVDLTESSGALLSYSQTQENAFQSLILVDGELMSYRTATLTGTFMYNITHLRRGLYGTPITSHQIGAPFTLVDSSMFQYVFNDSQIGTTVYFKFTSYNAFGQREQSLANVSPFQYRIRGPRFPYPWQANYQLGPSPWYTGGTIGAMVQYVQNADGSQQAGVLLTGYAAKNVFSGTTIAPTLGAITTASTGGSIAGGLVVLVGVTAIGSDGLETEMSPLVQVNVPTGTGTNTITINWTYNDPVNDLGARVYFASPDDTSGVFQYAAVSVSTTSETITATAINTNNYVDPLVYKYQAIGQIERHGGIWGGTVISETDHVTGSIIGIGGAWTVNQLTGRVISIFAKNNNTLAVDRADYTILSNTATTVRVSATVASAHVSVGDVVVIRTKADTFTATTIGDSLFANNGAGGSPTGLATNAEQGAQCIILHGTGAGQINTIASNTGTVLTLGSPWTITPDATSVFIVVATAQPYSASTFNFLASSDNTFVQIFLPVDNTAAQSYFIQVQTVDANGDTSQPSQVIQTYREIFVNGAAGSSAGITVVPYRGGNQL